MSAGAWLNNDGLILQYGVAKAYRNDAGEFLNYGANRVVEVLIDLSTLNTSNAQIVDLDTILPSMANFYVEKVELTAEVGMSTGSSPTLSVGVVNVGLSGGSTTVTYGTTATTGYQNTVTVATVPTNGGTAFVSSLAASSLSSAGDLVTLTTGVSGAGNYVGDYEDSTNLTSPMYITATLGTHTATGKIRCRIYYHGVGTIPN